jgi:fucose 4-O-acetylase-like acetyltransferase
VPTIIAQSPIDMKTGQYGIPLLSMAGAVSLAFLLVQWSKLLARWSPAAAALSPLGQRSLTVLYLHQAVHLGLRQFGIHGDILIIALSLAIPLLLDHPMRQLLKASEIALSQHLSRKSPFA